MTGLYYFCGHEQWQPETLVAHAVLAGQSELDGVQVSERRHPWVAAISMLGEEAPPTIRSLD
ncbi:MAG: hypothetical protein MUP76_11320 [Acidimicrobiia bacterium]|nr:hypothetical protein [Acidimicrobiia bacterium]